MHVALHNIFPTDRLGFQSSGHSVILPLLLLSPYFLVYFHASRSLGLAFGLHSILAQTEAEVNAPISASDTSASKI